MEGIPTLIWVLLPAVVLAHAALSDIRSREVSDAHWALLGAAGAVCCAWVSAEGAGLPQTVCVMSGSLILLAYMLTDFPRVAQCAMLLSAAVLYTFPGSPTVYYGDEAGMEGFEDPFNRQTYPWGHEDRELVDWYRALGALRRDHPALRKGSIRYVADEGSLLAFVREFEGERILCAFNAGEEAVRFVPGLGGEVEPLLGRIHLEQGEDGLVIIVPAHSGVALSLEKTVPLDWDSHWDVENATAD